MGKSVPMLFSGPMVRALLAGTKTQTRRAFKWQGPKGFPHSFEHAEVDNPAGVQRLLVPYNHPDEADLPWGESGCHRHYGNADPGDSIWVKETGWERPERTAQMMREGADTWAPFYYDTDLDVQDHADLKAWGFKRRPSIFMRRIFSRLTLHVTGARVQRLRDITDDDALAEGIVRIGERWEVPGIVATPFSPKDAYRSLWSYINGAESWEQNPWVVAITFAVEHSNIDAARLAA